MGLRIQGSGSAALPGNAGEIIPAYKERLRRHFWLFVALTAVLVTMVVLAVAVGAFNLRPWDVVRVLIGLEEGPQRIVVWDIRMPRIVAAVVTGWGLGLAGLAAQSLLRNPLASPFTLGISQGAAFGAAFAIVVLGAGGMQASALRTPVGGAFFIQSVYAVTVFAFIGSLLATVVILALARLRKMSSEAIVLAGVALSSLFTSGTILVQYFATDVEIAMVVFWTFGDVARSSWPDIGLLSLVTAGAAIYFVYHRWNLNAMSAGDASAQALGVEVQRLRLIGMLVAALVAALATAFHGVIAFLGLLAPHIARRLVGADHRRLVLFSGLIGALLLLAADTIGRLLVGSGTLPVGVLTSFMGAPLFLYLLMKGLRR